MNPNAEKNLVVEEVCGRKEWAKPQVRKLEVMNTEAGMGGAHSDGGMYNS